MIDTIAPRILLVDDKQANLLALSAVLAPLGYELVTTSSGEEALRVLLRDDVALIILDVRMPSLDGFETAELIRGRPRTAHIPLIFLTAEDWSPEHRTLGYERGAIDYICKPFDPAVLRAKARVLVQLWEQQKLIENQASELTNRLRLLDAAHADLARQADMLDRSNAALSCFAEAMANEVREPLLTLAGLAELLVERNGGLLSGDAEQLATRTASAARALSARVATLLDYARASTLPFDTAEVPLTELLAEASAELPGLSDCAVVTTEKAAITSVRGDRRQLRLMLAGILFHAASRSTSQPPRMKLGVVREDNSIIMSIHDDGAPIDPSEISRLFALFPTVERVDPSRPAGGLALARRIVERHGGEISYDSLPDGGLLSVRLPVGSC